MIPNKNNKNEWVTILFSKGKERSTQAVKRKSYNATKEKLERLGYSVKII